MARQKWYKRIPWIRLLLTIIAVLLITFCVAIIIYSDNSSNNIALSMLAGITALVTFGTWFFPFSLNTSEQPMIPFASELIPNNFKMGDNAAANFPYITE